MTLRKVYTGTYENLSNTYYDHNTIFSFFPVRGCFKSWFINLGLGLLSVGIYGRIYFYIAYSYYAKLSCHEKMGSISR